ncbi:MAG TPA: hypothetical protein VJY62_12755 [Bacteroidia bacterium]|nr:hypothetical protein [Bacteroidia bacterium]
MKLSTGKNKIVALAIVSGLLITFGEIIIDKIFGDGDGIISNYNIHKAIFTIQLVIVYFLFFIFINRLYVAFFKNKISANSVLLKAGKLFFLFVVFISCFIVLEMTSRYFFPGAGAFDRLYPVENARKPFPYVMFKGDAKTKTGFGEEVYNEYGYRGEYPKMPKDANEFRLIVAGGSAVWEGEPSIPQLLEKEFHKNNYTNVKVYNFGVVSSVSSMELVCIVNEIADLSPNLVILYNGANDIFFPLKYDPRPGYPFNFLVYENNPFLMRNYPALVLLAYKSNLVRVLGRKYFTEEFSHISRLKKNTGYGSGKWRNEIADIYISNLKKAKTICRTSHCEFFTFLQPMVYFKKNPSAEEQEFIAAHQSEKAHCQLLKSNIEKKLNAAGNDSAVFYFKDISTIYDDNPNRVFRDDVHTLQEAKLLAAKNIFNELKSKINFGKQ